MRRKSFAGMHCSIARTLEVVGEWWTILVLREAFRGARRFEDFEQGLGIATNILSSRLAKLVGHGVLERVPAPGSRRHEYRLTAKGRDLFPVLVALLQWGDRWMAGPGGPPVRITDRATGRDIAPLVLRDADGRPLAANEVRAVAGPGATDETRRRYPAREAADG
ncbi:MAG: helix-turn-helix transcriptional regulator [Alphaproteobacteria bacterium]|nr:helix-turn-helix transcriptional regulator [Alphaproteobacteria bacterium]